MILKPQIVPTVDNYPLKPGFKESYDDLWGKLFEKRRVACNKLGDVRIEKITIYPEIKLLTKECSFGKKRYDSVKPDSVCMYFDAKNNMYTSIDLNSGKCVQWGSDCKSPSYNCTGYRLYAGYSEEPEPTPCFISLDSSDQIYSTDKLEFCFTGFDLESRKADIYCAENSLQMGYTSCVGLLTSFFTQWSYSFPFDSFVIFDTSKGFNIPEFKYLNIVDKELGQKMYTEYIKSISRVFDIIKRNCEIEKKNIRIYIFTSAFTTVIKIKDHGLTLDYNLNASDHFDTIISNVESDGAGWCMSEECGAIMGTDNREISSDMYCQYILDIENIF